MDASIIISLSALGLATFSLYKQHKSQSLNVTNNYNKSWQVFNSLLIQDESLIEIERGIHPHGEVSKQDIKRIYYYFLRFNVAYGAFTGTGEMNSRLAESSLNNEANCTYADQIFIRENVFGRGYNEEFSNEFERRWKIITKTKQYLPMLGDQKLRKYAPKTKPFTSVRIFSDDA